MLSQQEPKKRAGGHTKLNSDIINEEYQGIEYS